MIKFTLLTFFIVTVAAKRNPNFEYSEAYGEFIDKNDYDQTNEDLVEIAYRQEVFFENMRKMKQVNDSVPHNLSENKYAHYTTQELAAFRLGGMVPKSMRNAPIPPLLNPPTNKFPENFDYTEYALPPMDQGICQSCYVVAAVGVIETLNKMKDPSWNYQLSPQPVLDCDKTNYKCNGGSPRNALNYYLNSFNNSIPIMNDYPYLGEAVACPNFANLKINNQPMNIKSANHTWTYGNETLTKSLLWTYGPLVASMQVPNCDAFWWYSGGVYVDNCGCFTGTKCGPGINHAVILMGWGTDKESGLDYWLIKNSWGESWGEKGYMKMARDSKNRCAINCLMTYVVPK